MERIVYVLKLWAMDAARPFKTRSNYFVVALILFEVIFKDIFESLIVVRLFQKFLLSQGKNFLNVIIS